MQWAHPKYENILATCGYDKKIKIWKEVKAQSWDVVYEFQAAASVGSISWAPWEYGVILGAGAADGTVHIIQRKGDDSWAQLTYPGHDGGVNALSWGPATEPSMLSHEHISSMVDPSHSKLVLPTKRFVTAGCDGKLKFWHFQENKFAITKELIAHEDWVRDVAWCNNIGLIQDTVASCSEDQKVKIWKRTPAPSSDPSKDDWVQAAEININCPAWKVSWSQVGNLLAVSGGDNQVTVLQEKAASGEWETVSKVSEEGVLEDVNIN